MIDMVSDKTIGALLCMLLLTVSIWTLALLGNPISTGKVPGTTVVNVVNQTSVMLTVSNISFGSLRQGCSNDTIDMSPLPLVIENTGSNKVNVTINATDLFSSAGNPTSYYRFLIAEASEGLCYNGDTLTSWTDMPTDAAKIIAVLNNSDVCDSAYIHVNVTVPSDEPVGAKSSTITFIAEQS